MQLHSQQETLEHFYITCYCFTIKKTGNKFDFAEDINGNKFVLIIVVYIDIFQVQSKFSGSKKVKFSNALKCYGSQSSLFDH